jgi:hypothetical protein
MNDYDIYRAVEQHQDPESARAKALKILVAHKQVVDIHSDGWAYWQPPVRAAKQLMELIQDRGVVTESMAHYRLKKALAPLRAFYTKHRQLPRPEGL